MDEESLRGNATANSIIIIIIIIETRNMSDRNRRFGASCAIIKVT